MSNPISPPNNEVVLYRSQGMAAGLQVRLEDETVWLTQAQIVDLFQSSKANVSEHIKHIFATHELIETATVRNFRTVQIEGNRKVARNVTYYNLDMIISIGYRVNSVRGTQFRIWANNILKDYLLKGYALNHRLEYVERKIIEHDNNFEVLMQQALPPKEGIFFAGQVFDAYKFVNDLVKSAKKSIVLIDNYIDESVLTLFSACKKGVQVSVYTSSISDKLKLDVEKFTAQYQAISVKVFKQSHDRFLIIDKTVYHFGASLKDLGNKWFAFSKMELSAEDIIKKLSH